ncbi:hypothetical protein HK105_205744 [Polyrhizophydium stewartii]|uniref:Fibronectin type-III domain-containing protein n=1 Tax=Polyrhizophydium stewartii TaxID=2732419 RepID=A0ABR4N5J8_9FUNG
MASTQALAVAASGLLAVRSFAGRFAARRPWLRIPAFHGVVHWDPPAMPDYGPVRDQLERQHYFDDTPADRRAVIDRDLDDLALAKWAVANMSSLLTSFPLEWLMFAVYSVLVLRQAFRQLGFFATLGLYTFVLSADTLFFLLMPYAVTSCMASVFVQLLFFWSATHLQFSGSATSQMRLAVIAATLVLRFAFLSSIRLTPAPAVIMAPLAAHCASFGFFFCLWKLLSSSYANIDAVGWLFDVAIPAAPTILVTQVSDSSFCIQCIHPKQARPGVSPSPTKCLSHMAIEINGVVIGEIRPTESSLLVQNLTSDSPYRVRVWAVSASKRNRAISNTIRLVLPNASLPNLGSVDPVADPDGSIDSNVSRPAEHDSHVHKSDYLAEASTEHSQNTQASAAAPSVSLDRAKLLAEYHAVLSQQQQLAEMLRSSTESFSEEEERLRSQLASLKEAKKLSDARRNELRARSKQLEESKRDADASKIRVDREIRALDRERSNLYDKCEALKKECAECTNEIERVESSSSEQWKRHQAETADIERQIKELQNQIELATKEHESQKLLVDNLASFDAKRRVVLSGIERETETLIHSTKELRDQETRLQERVRQLREQRAELLREQQSIQAALREEGKVKIALLQQISVAKRSAEQPHAEVGLTEHAMSQPQQQIERPASSERSPTESARPGQQGTRKAKPDRLRNHEQRHSADFASTAPAVPALSAEPAAAPPVLPSPNIASAPASAPAALDSLPMPVGPPQSPLGIPASLSQPSRSAFTPIHASLARTAAPPLQAHASATNSLLDPSAASPASESLLYYSFSPQLSRLSFAKSGTPSASLSSPRATTKSAPLHSASSAGNSVSSPLQVSQTQLALLSAGAGTPSPPPASTSALASTSAPPAMVLAIGRPKSGSGGPLPTAGSMAAESALLSFAPLPPKQPVSAAPGSVTAASAMRDLAPHDTQPADVTQSLLAALASAGQGFGRRGGSGSFGGRGLPGASSLGGSRQASIGSGILGDPTRAFSDRHGLGMRGPAELDVTMQPSGVDGASGLGTGSGVGRGGMGSSALMQGFGGGFGGLDDLDSLASVGPLASIDLDGADDMHGRASSSELAAGVSRRSMDALGSHHLGSIGGGIGGAASRSGPGGFGSLGGLGNVGGLGHLGMLDDQIHAADQGMRRGGLGGKRGSLGALQGLDDFSDDLGVLDSLGPLDGMAQHHRGFDSLDALSARHAMSGLGGAIGQAGSSPSPAQSPRLPSAHAYMPAGPSRLKHSAPGAPISPRDGRGDDFGHPHQLRRHSHSLPFEPKKQQDPAMSFSPFGQPFSGQAQWGDRMAAASASVAPASEGPAAALSLFGEAPWADERKQ